MHLDIPSIGIKDQELRIDRHLLIHIYIYITPYTYFDASDEEEHDGVRIFALAISM